MNKIHAIIISFILISISFSAIISAEQKDIEDIDPLVNLEVTVTIKEIRALDKIDFIGNPDFYVKVFINNIEHKSPVWYNQQYVHANWSITQDVPDNEENVFIKIQLWDWNFLRDKKCDIAGSSQQKPYNQDIEVTYSLKSGHWFGNDYIYQIPVIFDQSGYGRANGCDDNTIYQRDRDCEIWFDITQNDYDNDTIPYWTEVNIFGTDPKIDNTGEDIDEDGVPIEWEYKWGYSHGGHGYGGYHYWVYSPLEWNDHAHIDPDNDGLNNIEEYLTSQWGSDPFRKDIFIELDQMEDGPNGEKSILPDKSKYLIRDAFSKQNIVLHIDDGTWENSESDMIPFDESSTYNEILDIYYNYFLNGYINNWRRGIFHYGVIVYNHTKSGNAFSYDGKCIDAFQISSKAMEEKKIIPKIQRTREIVYASVYMHETGHTLGIFPFNTPGCDVQNGKYPWQINFWKWQNYKSCMNYRYVYRMVDYSDGSHGRNDFDDWSNIDLTFFETGFN